MICQKCGCTTKIIDSRSVDNGTSTRRRHECLKCRHRFTTYELSEKQIAESEKIRREYEKAKQNKEKLIAMIDNLSRRAKQ